MKNIRKIKILSALMLLAGGINCATVSGLDNQNIAGEGKGNVPPTFYKMSGEKYDQGMMEDVYRYYPDITLDHLFKHIEPNKAVQVVDFGGRPIPMTTRIEELEGIITQVTEFRIVQVLLRELQVEFYRIPAPHYILMQRGNKYYTFNTRGGEIYIDTCENIPTNMEEIRTDYKEKLLQMVSPVNNSFFIDGESAKLKITSSRFTNFIITMNQGYCLNIDWSGN